MKINFKIFGQIDWKNALKKNKYPLVSLLICLAYFYATFSAISFIVQKIRLAFATDQNAVNSRVIIFDIQNYDKISKRFKP